MQHSPRFLELVQGAKSRVDETVVQTIKKRMDSGETLVILDVREESEWNRGRLPGAIQLGRGILERDIERLVPDANQEIILYCSGGFRSALAADNLLKMGYTRPVSMDGGIQAWLAAGFPVDLE